MNSIDPSGHSFVATGGLLYYLYTTILSIGATYELTVGFCKVIASVQAGRGSDQRMRYKYTLQPGKEVYVQNTKPSYAAAHSGSTSSTNTSTTPTSAAASGAKTGKAGAKTKTSSKGKAGENKKNNGDSKAKGKSKKEGDYEKVNDSYLKEKGIDAEEVKKDIIGKRGSKYDIYRNKKTGELRIFRKGGKGEGQTTGIKIQKR